MTRDANDYSNPSDRSPNLLFQSDGKSSVRSNVSERSLAAPASQEYPNIVFILLDDLDYFDLSAYNPDSEIITPNLDFFAFKAMKMTEFYMGSVCYPTRAMLMSGRNALEFGVMNPREATSYRSVSEDTEFLPERLRKNGYYTGQFGKWHIGYLNPEHLPLANGFSTSVLRDVTRPLSYWDYTLVIDNDREEIYSGDEDDNTHMTKVVTDHALEFIRCNRDRPFFLNLWYDAPHASGVPGVLFEIPSKWQGVYDDDERGNFSALVSHADEQIGRIIDELDILGLAHNTIVVITSDNGGARWAHPGPSPLRGHKGTHFERGIKVPFLVRYPGKIPSNVDNASVGMAYDIFTTLADILGVDVSDLEKLRGKSLKNSWFENVFESRLDPIYWENKLRGLPESNPLGYLNKFAIREGDLKLVLEGDVDDPSLAPELYLFNLASDPGEAVDLSGDEGNMETINGLLQGYHDWRKENGRVDYEVMSFWGGDSSYSDIGNFFFSEEGVAILKPKSDFDFHDGDFSVEATINRAVGSDGNASIVRVHGSNSFVLKINPNGYLLFWLTDGDNVVGLLSQMALVEGVDYHVLASVCGHKMGKRLVRLYVGCDLHAESVSELGGVLHVDNPIVEVGNSKNLKQPFLGEIKGLSFYNVVLTDKDLPPTC